MTVSLGPPPPPAALALAEAERAAFLTAARPRPPFSVPAATAWAAFGAADSAGADPSYTWTTVVQLRNEAAAQLADVAGFDAMPEEERHQLARRLIRAGIVNQIGRMMLDGQLSWAEETQRQVAQDVFNMLFKLGRIQPLIDDPTVEDIHIHGRTTWLRRAGQTLEPGPSVAESSEELIEFLQFIAGRADPPRAFNPAQPVLNLDLGVGRLNATYGGVTAEPDVTIRLHRHRRASLDDMVALGTVTPVMASFLSAAVRCNYSIVVAGEMGAGKTTLVRALCGEIPPAEPIATIETDFELRLHEQPDQHWVVKAWQERQGHGDARRDGSRAGAFTVDDALFESFRQSVDRVIVGEVRGREIIGMIKAMQSGTGSLSTTHSQSARGAIDKLVTCAMETGVSEAYALRALGSSIRLVVYIKAETSGRQRRRFVTEIVAVGFTAEGIEFTDVFTRPPGAAGPARAAFMPDHFRDLASHGFDEASFNAESRQYKLEAGL
jgi:Flp pilus assembly CpaF family ATPase